MKYYIVDNMGNVLGEFANKQKALDTLQTCYSPEQIESEELEVIEG